jgi:alpha/beta superfamily hydrolase
MIALPEAPGRESWALEGLYRAVEAPDACGAVIAPPHPQMGGSMDSPVVSQVAFACDEAGLESLRFNWRGVGASAGQPSGEAADALEDYSAALDFIEESAAAPIVACGYSFGAAAAVAASDRPTVRRLVLVAPPPSFIDVERLKSFPGKVFLAAGDSDQFVDSSELEGSRAS